MPEPVSISLASIALAVGTRILSGRGEAWFKPRWEKLKNNLTQHHPQANQELEMAAYRCYLQATLQSCAVLLEQNNSSAGSWFKVGILPEKIAATFRSLLSDTPIGVFSKADKGWLEAVSHDHINKLKLLDGGSAYPPFAYEQEEFAKLLSQIELLMRPEDVTEREQLIRDSLTTRVLNDLTNQFGEVPARFQAVVRECWFEFLCAGFQHDVNHQPEIGNAFESELLAKLVVRSEWQQQLTALSGEALKRIEEGQLTLLQRVEHVSSVLTEQGEKDGQRFENLKASIDRLVPQASAELEPLIHTLSTQQEIEGRAEECSTILHAMSECKQRVVAFAAPGGFGKSALLTKVVQQLSSDGKTVLKEVELPGGETIRTNTTNLLHVDCRNNVKLSALFANAGRLIGQERAFQEIYNSDLTLPDKLAKIFSRLSSGNRKRTWFLFDNFEPLLNQEGEIADEELSEFFNGIFAGGHSVYALVSSREVPRFSPNKRVLELTALGSSLFDGLPIDDCIAYLNKNGAEEGLRGTKENNDAVLREFALRVHRIPLALVWAVGYLQETDFTLKEILERGELFADFDREQAKDDERYENKGLKRLHYEQLKIQISDNLSILRLLAFFKRPVPRGALAHLLDEIELNKVLTRLERNKLLTHRESVDAYTLYINDHWALNLYGLHPVICENEFFDTLPDTKALYETAAYECWVRGSAAYKVNRFAYAIELFDCAEKLYEHLTKEGARSDLLNSYAGMLMNKGVALDSLTRVTEAVAEYEKAIAIRERLVNIELQSYLANDLALTYLNKGVALNSLKRLTEAVVEYDKAIKILNRLVNVEMQANLANHLAAAYMNRGVALDNLTKLTEAVAEYDKAIAIRERLVNVEQQAHLANDLAAAYMNKGVALDNLSKVTEAVAEYDKAIAIRERLVNIELQFHLANYLATAYMNKGVALSSLTRLTEALAVYDKAIKIRERLVNVEMQAHLANDLAAAYFNKALGLEQRQDWEGALSCYTKSIQARTLGVERLKMFWIVPELLKTLRSRLMTLLYLQRWPLAAQDVLWFLSLYVPYADSDAIDDRLKNSANIEFAQMIAGLRKLTNKQRELVFAELGEKADMVRSHVSKLEED